MSNCGQTGATLVVDGYFPLEVSVAKPTLDGSQLAGNEGSCDMRCVNDSTVEDSQEGDRLLLLQYDSGTHLKLLIEDYIERGSKEKTQLAQQGFRCAGCAVDLRPHRDRPRALFCAYTGMVFCKNCHGGSKASIPGRIVKEWDFNKYLVCDVAFEYVFLRTLAQSP